MSSIANAEDGFDWTIDINTSSTGYYIHPLRIGYPTLGAPDVANLTFDYPGSITNYYQTSSMTSSGTNIYLIGSDTETTPLLSTYVHTDMTSSGVWLRYDDVVSRKDISNQSILNDLAMRIGKKRRAPGNVVKMFVKGDQDPEFGSYGLGDACQIVF